MLSKLEEIKLIARCVAADDHRAFARLVDEHSPAVRNFLFRLTMGDAALTDDLSQDTFIKAWSGLRSFKAAARFRTWLFTIAYHEFIGHARRMHESPLPGPDSLNLLESSSDNESRRTELRHDIDIAMRVLTPTERTLIVLFYIDDLPIKEICRITSLPSGTVKSYLSRAKTKMANFLTNS